MAERIVSPGVFTRERDLSFLPQAIGEIGAAIIGPTVKGPAFTPTQVTSFQEFEQERQSRQCRKSILEMLDQHGGTQPMPRRLVLKGRSILSYLLEL